MARVTVIFLPGVRSILVVYGFMRSSSTRARAAPDLLMLDPTNCLCANVAAEEHRCPVGRPTVLFLLVAEHGQRFLWCVVMKAALFVGVDAVHRYWQVAYHGTLG